MAVELVRHKLEWREWGSRGYAAFLPGAEEPVCEYQESGRDEKGAANLWAIRVYRELVNYPRGGDLWTNKKNKMPYRICFLATDATNRRAGKIVVVYGDMDGFYVRELPEFMEKFFKGEPNV